MYEKIKDIGDKTGCLLIFGGVYSNLQALEKLVEIADNKGVPPQNIICTGDVAGYCAQPEECLQKIKQWNIHCITGNVEQSLREGANDCGCQFVDGGRCDAFSKQWYPYAYQSISNDSIQWMNQLPRFITFNYYKKKVLVVHGSWFNISDYIFKSTSWHYKQQNFDESGADIILAGHSGIPFHDIKNSKMWLNAGVIGMPANDGTTRVWYMIIHPNDNNNRANEIIFDHQSFEYNHEKAYHLMKDNNLPMAYANTLLNGLWDNCEILPEQETNEQGVFINL